jgi:hypothetical protein
MVLGIKKHYRGRISKGAEGEDAQQWDAWERMQVSAECTMVLRVNCFFVDEDRKTRTGAQQVIRHVGEQSWLIINRTKNTNVYYGKSFYILVCLWGVSSVGWEVRS